MVSDEAERPSFQGCVCGRGVGGINTLKENEMKYSKFGTDVKSFQDEIIIKESVLGYIKNKEKVQASSITKDNRFKNFQT